MEWLFKLINSGFQIQPSQVRWNLQMILGLDLSWWSPNIGYKHQFRIWELWTTPPTHPLAWKALSLQEKL